MKIGKLQFKDYAAKKPLAITSTGRFISANEVLSTPSLRVGSLISLPNKAQLKLALERYRLEPDFHLGIVGVGILTKSEIVEHLKAQDEFGQLALQAEMGYCQELTASLTGGILPAWPKIPKPPLPPKPEWKPIKKCIMMKVKTRALFCENTTDAVTTPMANYRIGNVHPVFQARGFTVVKLTGTDDVRNNFVPQAKNALTVYTGGIGHGAYTLYTGHQGNHILEVGQYDPAEVKGKAHHFLSCQTAKQLGPDTVANGAKCYAGYDENFHFVWDNAATPVNEFLLFAQSDSTFDIVMANGGTAQQAYNATVQAFNAAIAQVPNTAAATWLTYDRDHLRLLGIGATTVVPYRYVKVCLPLPTQEKENALVAAGEVVD